MKEVHQVGMGVGVALLVVLVGGATFVGYRFYRRNTKPFQFHYFKVRLPMVARKGQNDRV